MSHVRSVALDMDGARVVRIEIDKDGDGAIDRWEYYGPNQEVLRVGASKRHNGREDRVEYFQRGTTVPADEDTDGDGKTGTDRTAARFAEFDRNRVGNRAEVWSEAWQMARVRRA